jgi:ketosteroid isomerase-like protein
LLPACAGRSDVDPAQVRALIEARNADFERWYATGAIDSAAMMFAEDAWQLPPNQPPLVGREAYRGFWTRATGWGLWEFDLRTEDVVVDGPIAVERGSYSLVFTPDDDAPEGMGSVDDQGNYVVLWRLDPDGVWRVVWDAPVSTKPLPASPE